MTIPKAGGGNFLPVTDHHKKQCFPVQCTVYTQSGSRNLLLCPCAVAGSTHLLKIELQAVAASKNIEMLGQCYY